MSRPHLLVMCTNISGCTSRLRDQELRNSRQAASSPRCERRPAATDASTASITGCLISRTAAAENQLAPAAPDDDDDAAGEDGEGGCSSRKAPRLRLLLLMGEELPSVRPAVRRMPLALLLSEMLTLLGTPDGPGLDDRSLCSDVDRNPPCRTDRGAAAAPPGEGAGTGRLWATLRSNQKLPGPSNVQC